MILLALSPRATAFTLLLGGAVALYAASLVGVRALAGRDPGRPGGRAVGHWLPIAAAVLAAVVFRRFEVATGVAFATSVACLSLMMGLLSYFSAPEAQPPASRRAWPFVLPAAMLAMMAGFSSHLSILHAGMMALLGLAVWSVWTDPAATPDAPTSAALMPADGASSDDVPLAPLSQPVTQRYALLALAIVLAVAGAWAAVKGVVGASETSRWLPSGLLAAAVLSPILTMPMLASSSALGERGQASSMASTLVGVALLNLCALLPAAVVLWHVLPGVTHYASRVLNLDRAAVASTQPSIDDVYAETDGSLLQSLLAGAEPMPYPLTVWRIDTVILVVLGFALLPVALGRWTIGRAEAAGLMIGYAVYLALVMALAGRV